MRFGIFFIFVLVIFIPDNQLVGQNSDEKKWSKLVDQYIDQRYEGTAADTKKIVAQFNKAGVTQLEDLEKELRSPRANYPDIIAWVGKISVHKIDCQHVDYSSRYFLYLPKDIDLTKPVGLVVVGHGGNSSMSVKRAEQTAAMYLQAYRKLADRMKVAMVAPASGRGWGQIGNSLIFSSISKIQRALPIDPDRIFITGQSMGGHLSYRTALSFPDRFGAVSPHSGGYDFVAKKSIGNLVNIPGYAIWGVREPYGINKDNRTNAQWAKSHDLNWKFVEKNGGHTIYQDEMENIADFFKANPRDLYRKQVYIRSGGTFKFVKTWQIKGWPEHEVYSKTKPLRWNMRHWLEVEPRPDSGEPLTILAINRGDNHFEVTSNNVRQFSIYLHPKMVDFKKPVSVMVNGKQVFNDPIQMDPGLMFELAREFDDRGRLFWGRIDLRITSDKEVEIFPKDNKSGNEN